jgi:glucose/arabinose dehydrogenase
MVKTLQLLWLLLVFAAPSYGSGKTVSPGTVIGWGATLWLPGQQASMTNITSFASISVANAIALRADRTVMLVGDYARTQTVPDGITNIVAVASGGTHFMALKEDGTVVDWSGIGGQPTPPPGLTDIVAISAGAYTRMVLRRDGTVVTWGTSFPTPPLSNIVAICAGAEHFMALGADGKVMGWGKNDRGQASVPPDLANVTKIVAAVHHNVALLSDGTVRAWGGDDAGETHVPPGLSNVISIAAGTYHSVALRADGKVISWGLDYGGPPDGYNDFQEIFTTASSTVGITRMPVILKQPTDITVQAGSDTAFVPEVISTLPFSCQWFRNNAASGTNVVLRFENAQENVSGVYYFEVSSTAGTIKSAEAKLIVNPQVPLIVSSPSNFSLLEGSSTNVYVQVKGSEPFEYQWYHKGEPIESGTNSILPITAAGPAEEGDYYVIVTNGAGSAGTFAFKLTVLYPPRIGNEPGSLNPPAGSDYTFRAIATGTPPLSFQWYLNANLIGTAPLISLYNLQSKDDGALSLVVSNPFGVVSNLISSIAVSNRPPSILHDPRDQLFQNGGVAVFAVGAKGTEPMQYQWFKDELELSGQTGSTLVLSGLSTNQKGQYRVRVSNTLGEVFSNPALLSETLSGPETIDWPSVELIDEVTTNFTQVTHIANAGDGSGRLFVVEKVGRIQIVTNHTRLATPFMDITSRVLNGDEQGLLSIAFAKDYKTSKQLYVNYTRKPDGATVVSRFQSGSDSNSVDPAGEQILLVVPQPAPNHNGGQIAFGPDNYLYIGMGDGGGVNDPLNYAQNPSSLLGKILRIDVSGGSTNYLVPSDNPFSGQNAFRPEIWALGLRNPWRFSFDSLRGDLYIGDVGEDKTEEVDFQPAGQGGQNYGWSFFEGSLVTLKGSKVTNQSSFVFPVSEYSHNQGRAVTGGIVSRGTGSARFYGIYFFADYISGRIWGLKRVDGQWQRAELATGRAGITTFGSDENDNMYVAVTSSASRYKVMRLADGNRALPPVFSPAPGTYGGEQNITLSSMSPDVRIHYRTDGTEPNELDPFVISGQSVTISSNLVLTARAFRGDLLPSTVSTGKYTLYVKLSFQPPQQSVTNGTLLSITGFDSNTSVRYTLDGSDVTEQSTLYSGPILLEGDETIKVLGSKSGLNSTSYEYYYGLLERETVAIRTLAGSGAAGLQDGRWHEARFNRPEGICVDSLGNVFVADRGNKAIRKISPDGNVVTLPVSDHFSDVMGICVDNAGNLFVTDAVGYQVVKIAPDGGTVVVAAGTDSFRNLGHIAVNSAGDLFVGDWASIKKITTAGEVQMFAGTGANNIYGWSGDVGVGLGINGEVFAGISHGRVYQIAAPGEEEVYAGSTPGHSDGPRLKARFTDALYINRAIAREVAGDGNGNLYVADRSWIRKVGTAGRVSTLLPAGGSFYAGLVSFATGVTVDQLGNIYVADTVANKIKKIAPDIDGDGILDTEEGDGTPFQIGRNDQSTDSDDDGMSNFEELVAGTDPSRKESLLWIDVNSSGLEWNSVAGRLYRVEKSLDFQMWTPVTEWVSGNGSVLSFTPHSETNEFYRVTVTQM